MENTAQRTPQHPNKRIDDYTLRGNDGRNVKLSEIIGTRDHLIVLHNMGETCPSCLIYGSEFNGALKHIEARAAFCAVGPDDSATQKAYVERNGWEFNLYSGKETSFIKDLGFEDEEGNAQPGISILEKKNDSIMLASQVNIAKEGFCPSALDLLGMLPEKKTNREEPRMKKIRSIAAIVMAGFLFSLTATAAEHRIKPLPRNLEIQLALSALPPHLRDKATPELMKKSATGWWVMPRQTWGAARHAAMTRISASNRG